MNGETVYVYSGFGAILGVVHSQEEAEEEIRKVLAAQGVPNFRQVLGASTDPRTGKPGKESPEDIDKRCRFFVDAKSGKPVAFWGKFEIGGGSIA